MSGKLNIIIGPMYSGKSTKLIKIYNENTLLMKKICVINYIGDNRYGDKSLCSHDGKKINCLKLKLLNSIKDKYFIDNYDMFIIDEAQFYPDLVDVCKFLIDNNKEISVAGLSSDFQMKKFGNIIDLIPLCNNIEKLNTQCSFCQNKAYFTKRLTNDISQKLIGNDIYKPVCRLCHKKKITKNEMDFLFF